MNLISVKRILPLLCHLQLAAIKSKNYIVILLYFCNIYLSNLIYFDLSNNNINLNFIQEHLYVYIAIRYI